MAKVAKSKAVTLDVLVERPIESYIREIEVLRLHIKRTRAAAIRIEAVASAQIREAVERINSQIEHEKQLLKSALLDK
jgi:ACT domain-containing protein